MSLEFALQKFPRHVTLKEGLKCEIRPLEPRDEMEFHEFFLAVPERERMFMKHRVTDTAVIHDWCTNIDLGHNLPLLAISEGRIVGNATLHQKLGGWKRHIGRISVLVHPNFRGKGIARTLLVDQIELARHAGLQKAEAEFIVEQEAAIKVFAMMGFRILLELPDYVKDMQAIAHDYILMGRELLTDEEYAGVGG
jgi:GNAT superfamily N-acetyltransferase